MRHCVTYQIPLMAPDEQVMIILPRPLTEEEFGLLEAWLHITHRALTATTKTEAVEFPDPAPTTREEPPQ